MRCVLPICALITALALSIPNAATADEMDRVDNIINHALEPTIDDPNVVLAQCPYEADSYGCTLAPRGSPIWVTPSLLTRFGLLHEMGHRYRFDVMTTKGLRRFTVAMHIRHWNADVEEQFADAYATCALGWVPSGTGAADSHFPTGYSYWPTRKQQARVCDIIANADP